MTTCFEWRSPAIWPHAVPDINSTHTTSDKSQVTCPSCLYALAAPCPTCDGAGVVDTSPPGVDRAPWLQTDTDCPRCAGSGEISEEPE